MLILISVNSLLISRIEHRKGTESKLTLSNVFPNNRAHRFRGSLTKLTNQVDKLTAREEIKFSTSLCRIITALHNNPSKISRARARAFVFRKITSANSVPRQHDFARGFAQRTTSMGS